MNFDKRIMKVSEDKIVSINDIPIGTLDDTSIISFVNCYHKKMNNNLEATICKVNEDKTIDVCFEDGTIVKNVSYLSWKQGRVAHPTISISKPVNVKMNKDDLKNLAKITEYYNVIYGISYKNIATLIKKCIEDYSRIVEKEQKELSAHICERDGKTNYGKITLLNNKGTIVTIKIPNKDNAITLLSIAKDLYNKIQSCRGNKEIINKIKNYFNDEDTIILTNEIDIMSENHKSDYFDGYVSKININIDENTFETIDIMKYYYYDEYIEKFGKDEIKNTKKRKSNKSFDMILTYNEIDKLIKTLKDNLSGFDFYQEEYIACMY